MAKVPLNATDTGMPHEAAGAGGSDQAPVVELTAEQLYALCVAVARAVEDDHPSPELLAVRAALEAVEEQLLWAWADVQLAFGDAGGCQASARGTGVT